MLKPIGDRILVKPHTEEARLPIGIYLPETAREKPQIAEVLAVGKGKLGIDGKIEPLYVEEGDSILYSKYGGTEVRVDGQDLLLLKESDILAVV